VDILIADPHRVLVITGPNTGGKTVALKAAGLLSLMAQAGLHIPAAPGSRLPVFRSVFADIGDEQSIVASLSTFSWHITNIASMDRSLTLPALILLDELGAGTDPVEGGALGMSLLEHFRRRGALVIATTHYDMLKSYASTTEGVVSAAFGFNPDTFAPTYRLLYGSPGRSLALEIAARLGLPGTVIDEARQYRSNREAQLAEHLARVEREISALDHDRRLASAERAALDDRELRVRGREDQLRQREEALRQRAQQEVEQRLRDARREIDKVIDDLKRQTAALAAEAARRTSAHEAPLSTGETGLARANARNALESVADRTRDWTGFAAGASGATDGIASPDSTGAAEEPRAVRETAFSVGDRVTIGRLGLEGIVRGMQDRDAEVEVRGKRMRVPLSELRTVAGGAAKQQAHVSVSLQPRETVPTDLNVIGCSVDEALDRVEKFLDEAMLAEQRSVRFIHGYGTGQLRRAIADFLHHHPLVARFAAAPPEQGGGGVTVAELKD
jgi:DNA mismatch repair protein MutS2